MKLTIVLLAMLISCPIGSAAQAPDPFVGSWVLDVRASKYPGSSCPRAMEIEMTQEAGGIHYHSHTTPAVGEAFDVDYTAAYDGKPAMVTGTKGILLPVSLSRKASTVTATYRSAFQIAAKSERSLSADNRTMTITTMSYDAMGTAVTNIGVYRRAAR